MNAEKIMAYSKQRVCKMCGGSLEPRIIIYNKYGGQGIELYCPNCQQIEYGTSPEIYALAKSFVTLLEFDYFPDMEEGKKKYELNIAKVCEMLDWCFRKIKISSKEGINRDMAYLFTEVVEE